MTTDNDELATAREMQDFALRQYRKFHHQAEYRAQQYGNKAARDEASERALSASVAFFLATQRVEQLTGTKPGTTFGGPLFPTSDPSDPATFFPPYRRLVDPS